MSYPGPDDKFAPMGPAQEQPSVENSIAVVRGDITTLDVDAIVNAANASLCGGGGVDGAIHRAAGPALLEHCRTLGASRPGQVTMTPAFELPMTAILHAVGPVWSGGERGEPAQLRSCYGKACALCDEHELQSVAFPAISTGAYRYPPWEAARIAVETVRSALAERALPARVVFCCFSERDARLYRDVMGR